MAATASPVAPHIKPGVAPLRAGEGTSFLLRRLHSLTGVVPIGAFLLEHFISNAEAFKGPIAYGKQVEFLNSLPFVFFSNCSSSGFRSSTTASTASTSGIKARPTSALIPGRATGSTRPSAGPASSRSPTWCSTLITCASLAYTCRRTPCSRSPRFRENFKIRGWSPSTRSASSPLRGISATDCGCSPRSGASPPVKGRDAALAMSAWRLLSAWFRWARPACTDS